MSQLDDLIKSIKKSNYEKALEKKKSTNRIARESKSDIAQETSSLKEYRLNKEEKAKIQPESGTEAVDRILKEIKTARGSVMSGDKPLYPGDFPEPMPDEQRYKTGRFSRGGIDESKTPIPFKSATGLYEKEAKEGIPGTTSYIGGQRVKELEGNLSTAQSAKESGKSFPQEGMDEAVQAKYREYIELFDQPKVSTPYHNYGDSKVTSGGRGRYVPKEKSRHLAELATREWFKKTYGQ
jgi:hypothetical protein|tara:strand:- start:148 stop:861 length:714 start_codon:yes stop_codon:yes gene_type:complete